LLFINSVTTLVCNIASAKLRITYVYFSVFTHKRTVLKVQNK